MWAKNSKLVAGLMSLSDQKRTEWVVWRNPVLLTEGISGRRIGVVEHQHASNDPVDVCWGEENAI